MSDRILDSMIEARNAQEWEDLNQEPEVDAGMAVEFLGYALGDLETVVSEIGEAAGAMKGDPMEYRILSLLEDIGRVQDDMTSMRARLEEVTK